ncbi:acyl-CoA dehydrogenase family protein [Celeribacter indicus]|uniref:Acyl-CoA dehydrogenase n=1 Tax=Celeribacter indicus TaxID=1208324 RepID=A0A0B5E8W3_9RHOB|nr:acyl-CoA dehydrogenase family protein [Celeribacter indicus]AJE48752.1 acyl-CoA dehydrogenase [Celeribacter indicus]SDX11436.1 Acyl-CoA dehydrogenase [Celeribacter indicus]
MTTTLKTVPVLDNAAEAFHVARDYAESIREGAGLRDRKGTPPYDELRALAQTGLLGINIPRAYGGAGVAISEVIDVIRILASVDSSIAQTVQSHFTSIDRLRVMGPEHLRRRLYPRILAGERLSNASAERGGKSAASFVTRINRQTDGSYLIEGRKYYTTGALTSQWIAVRALSDDNRLATAYVPRDTPGIQIDDDWHGFGQRSTTSGTATFTAVRVPAELVDFLPYHGPESDINKALAFLTHGAIETGIAENALHDGTDFVRTKARPHAEIITEGGADVVAEDLLVQAQLGRLATSTHAARAMVLRAAEIIDAVHATGDYNVDNVGEALIAVSEAKAFAAEVALETSTAVIGLVGASATDLKHALDRHWRNARTHSVHDSLTWKYVQAGRYLLTGEAPNWAPFTAPEAQAK